MSFVVPVDLSGGKTPRHRHSTRRSARSKRYIASHSFHSEGAGGAMWFCVIYVCVDCCLVRWLLVFLLVLLGFGNFRGESCCFSGGGRVCILCVFFCAYSSRTTSVARQTRSKTTNGGRGSSLVFPPLVFPVPEACCVLSRRS